ncbi:MAG: hypothetical protein ACREMH_10655 [Gemmatimonadales bacterium]
MWALILLLVVLPSALRAQLAGTLHARTYTSPDSSFSLRLPRVLDDTATVKDELRGVRDLTLSVNDGLCRQVLLVETRGELAAGETLDRWVSREVVARMNPQSVLGLERRQESGRFGPVVWLTWQSPKGFAPCQEIQVSNGRRTGMQRPPAAAAMAVFHRSSRFYRVLYIAGLNAMGPLANGIRRLPPDSVLVDILGGFESR